MIILGIDPGTATTGYGVIKQVKGAKSKISLKCLDYGCIRTSPNQPASERLRQINNQLAKLIKKHKPEVLAVESIYFFKNLKTAIPVSQVKGIILLKAAQKKIPIYEITPLQAKMVVTGYGKAEKIQVQKMIKNLLNLPEIPRPDDAADALAVALSCFRLKKTKAA